MSASVYRALRSAGYPDAGIIEFATSLLAELCDDKGASGEEHPPLDVRTGFPTGRALVEILEFEVDRARSTAQSQLGVIVGEANKVGDGCQLALGHFPRARLVMV